MYSALIGIGVIILSCFSIFIGEYLLYLVIGMFLGLGYLIRKIFTGPTEEDKLRKQFADSSDPRDILCMMVVNHLLRPDNNVKVTQQVRTAAYRGEPPVSDTTYYSSTKPLEIITNTKNHSVFMKAGTERFELSRAQIAFVMPKLQLIHKLIAAKKAAEKQNTEQMKALTAIEEIFKAEPKS